MTQLTRFIALTGAALLALAAGRGATAAAIAVGDYTPSTTMPFVVPIEISGAADLVTWQFDLAFDPADLQVNVACDPFADPHCDLLTGPVTEGPFTSSSGQRVTLFIPGVIDNIAGVVSIVAGAYSDLPPGPSGSGVLAYIEFIAIGNGDSAISVQNVAVTEAIAVPEPGTLPMTITALALLVVAHWRSGVPRTSNSRRLNASRTD